MEVKLYIKPQAVDNLDLQQAVANIMAVCRGKQKGGPHRLMEALRSGHTSLLEHLQFTWRCTGWPRDMLLELERHRHTSMTVSSTRAIDMSDFEMKKPVFVTAEHEIRIHKWIEETKQLYSDMRTGTEDLLKGKGFTDKMAHRIAQDEVRRLLPGGTLCNFFFSCNARELVTVLMPQRLCDRAHPDIKFFVAQLCDCVNELIPDILELGGPPCWFGKCNEKEPCR
jgi:flavin-dependent thymidylate synthase